MGSEKTRVVLSNGRVEFRFARIWTFHRLNRLNEQEALPFRVGRNAGPGVLDRSIFDKTTWRSNKSVVWFLYQVGDQQFKRCHSAMCWFPPTWTGINAWYLIYHEINLQVSCLYETRNNPNEAFGFKNANQLSLFDGLTQASRFSAGSWQSLLIEPFWNGNLFLPNRVWRQLHLLIEPFWNGNLRWASVSLLNLAFNRTILEWKSCPRG